MQPADAPKPAEQPKTVAELARALEAVSAERDEYRRSYLVLLEAYRKLEAGLYGQKRERFVSRGGEDEQLALQVLGMLTGAQEPAKEPETLPVPAHERRKPTGRKPLPETLPRIEVELLPPEVQQKGLEAFERIGEDCSEVVERRPASIVVVRTVRPKFVEKGREQAPSHSSASESEPANRSGPVLQAEPAELPLPRALCGPGMLSDTIVHRWDQHQPLHRMERMYGRDGLPLARSTICDWHSAGALLVMPLIEAMWADAVAHSPYLCIDATGVLVQAESKCRRGHFFVVVAPGRHVLFRYTPNHDGAAVDEMLAGYRGVLVADAHSVYDHLYSDGTVVQSCCWAHARRYWFKALDYDGTRARVGLSLIQQLFKLEREYATSPPEVKLARRQREAKPIVEAFFAYCEEEKDKVVDESPLAKAITYARNQRDGLCRFLGDGRLPIHNNHSENALRREALGRKNWLFLGSDEGGEVNAAFVTLLASCQLHGIEPRGYLRDLFCVLPSWPVNRVLELAPMNWTATIARGDVQQALAANIYRQAALGLIEPKQR